MDEMRMQYYDITNNFDECMEQLYENIISAINIYYPKRKRKIKNKTHQLTFRSVSNEKKCNENKLSIDKIQFNGKEIKRVEETKFLGLIIDEKLKFDKHIDDIIKNLKKIRPFLYKIRNILNNSERKIIYYALIYSKITYAIEAYSNTSWANLKPLEKMHKRLIKILYNMKLRTETKHVYEYTELLDVRHVIIFKMTQVGYSWAHNKLPNRLNEEIEEHIINYQGARV